jgi:hypothetical protein
VASIAQMNVAWSGAGVIGLSTSTFYSSPGGSNYTASLNALKAFFTAIAALLPATVTITFPATGKVYDDVTGQLQATWAAAPPAAVVGTGAGAFASASGASVGWSTGAIVTRHTLVGRTFLVPLIAGAFNANGVLSPASVTTILGGANNVPNSGTLRVWSRPNPPLKPTGASSLIIGASVRNLGAVLRSRRT